MIALITKCRSCTLDSRIRNQLPYIANSRWLCFLWWVYAGSTALRLPPILSRGPVHSTFYQPRTKFSQPLKAVESVSNLYLIPAFRYQRWISCSYNHCCSGIRDPLDSSARPSLPLRSQAPYRFLSSVCWTTAPQKIVLSGSIWLLDPLHQRADWVADAFHGPECNPKHYDVCDRLDQHDTCWQDPSLSVGINLLRYSLVC